jgi:hypothetical protein|nr:MAG TPA: putative periplasmic lipoprotein [Caudoviricetes sp.]
MKIVDSILKMNDKVLHFIACLVLTMTVGEIGALSAALTKEGADWLYKKNCNVGSGWDWGDILADTAGIMLGSLIRRMFLHY